MKRLGENWLTEGLIDFEYKKYVLLSYLKEINALFDENRLYPYLSDLVFHYRNLSRLKENKDLLYDNFPEEISEVDLEKLKVVYNKIINDDEVMQELENILKYSLNEIHKYLEKGKEIHENVEQDISIEPVGLYPLYNQEGYLIIDLPDEATMDVYEYQLTLFRNSYEKFRAIRTQYLESVKKGLGTTFGNIKIRLSQKYRKLPNPSTFLVKSNVFYPFKETFMPVVKRLLMGRLAQQDTNVSG